MQEKNWGQELKPEIMDVAFYPIDKKRHPIYHGSLKAIQDPGSQGMRFF